MELCQWACHDMTWWVPWHTMGVKKKKVFELVARHDSLQARAVDVDVICRQQECGDGG